ncbi:hypothetical protein CAPTEDRAFT_202465 [Capitella teleta]|uniref:Protein XRP2 n=1 Tax=Capitella teleta TaxID=283909 RepID=R7UPS7_CAPTE|nr:hypothetical protein CAPTEDRAFT_202465 [Capitella teleta]|eukprot:ELU05952.1 hypothetical protein CAPTEDRAFT_202465 [Capitella teleta]
MEAILPKTLYRESLHSPIGAMLTPIFGMHYFLTLASRDKRDKVDPKDFTIEDLNGETAGRAPGSINGQQFIIRNCQDSNIYILDHMATITIDDCVNCRIFLGPTKSSVFIRDCKDCKFALACQQLRTRDCHRIDFFLFCSTFPSIESSVGFKLECFQCYYPELEDQFKAAGLGIYDNNWSRVHDFSIVPGESNYGFLPLNSNLAEYIPLPDVEKFNVAMNGSKEFSVVPYTLGSRPKPSDESCLVVFFNDGLSQERAHKFIAEMNKTGEFVIVQSKEVSMQPQDVVRVFNNDSYAMVAEQGPVIGFEFNGNGVCAACQDSLMAINKGSTGAVFASSSPAAAAQQIESFYNFVDIKMAV